MIVAVFNKNEKEMIKFIGDIKYGFSKKKVNGNDIAEGGNSMAELIYSTLKFIE